MLHSACRETEGHDRHAVLERLLALLDVTYCVTPEDLARIPATWKPPSWPRCSAASGRTSSSWPTRCWLPCPNCRPILSSSIRTAVARRSARTAGPPALEPVGGASHPHRGLPRFAALFQGIQRPGIPTHRRAAPALAHSRSAAPDAQQARPECRGAHWPAGRRQEPEVVRGRAGSDRISPLPDFPAGGPRQSVAGRRAGAASDRLPQKAIAALGRRNTARTDHRGDRPPDSRL